MSFQAVDKAFAIQNITPSEKLILLTLGKFYNNSTYQCNPSVSTLSEVSGVSKRTVIRSINRLESLKIISLNKTKHANGFENNTTQYQLLYLSASDNLSSASDNLSSASDNLSSASDNLSSASDTVSPNTGMKLEGKGVDTVFETTTTTQSSKTPETEKKAVVVKSEKKPDLEIIDSHNKPTPEQISSTQRHLDRFVNDEPFTPEVDPNEIVFSEYELGCFQWASSHNFWVGFTDGKKKFLSTLHKTGGSMKPEYERWLRNQQAQKSPDAATNNNQGLQTLNQNTGTYHVTQYQQPQRKLSLAEEAADATRRGIAFADRVDYWVNSGFNEEDAKERARHPELYVTESTGFVYESYATAL